MNKTPEYEALERLITADKRYRRFVYLLTLLVFIIMGLFAMNLANKTADKQIEASKKSAKESTATRITIARETIRYTTCLLIVPQKERTKEIQQKCFEKADLPGGLTRGDFSPIVPTDLEESAVVSTEGRPALNGSGDYNESASSAKTTPNKQPAQPDSSQPPQPTRSTPPQDNRQNTVPIVPACRVDLFFLHVACD